MKKKIVILLICISSFSLFGCQKSSKKEILTRTELFMGTSIKVNIYNTSDNEILDKVFERVKEIEELVSINKDGTEIDNLNESAGNTGVKLSEDSINIIKKGIYYSSMSNGGYDISIGPLVKLWNIGFEGAKVPTSKEIDDVLDDINYKNIHIDGNTVMLEKEDMMLDLGSIAKGYAADEIAKILSENKIEKAIIDLGGNIYVLGEKEKNTPWKVGVQNPFSTRGDVIGTVKSSNKSIVTTGIYERYIDDGENKYHHVLDPKTGYPYETSIAGVTIIADKSIDADAISTMVFTMGIEEGIEFIEKEQGIDAIFITNEREVYTTSGVKDNFELVNSDFIFKN